MRTLLQVVSYVSLALTILPSALFLAGKIDLPMVKWLMLLGMIGWFAVTPFWMGREDAA